MDCFACGNPFTPGTADEGCQVDALCISCTPSAGRCGECKQLRREDAAAADWAWFRELSDVKAWAS